MGDLQQRVHPVLQMEANNKKTSPAPAKTQHLPTQRPAREKTQQQQLPIQRPLPPPPLMVRNNKKRNLCCRIFCWGLSLLIIALIALAVAVAVIYFVFHPKLPQYEVNSLRVSNLGINLDLSLSALFEVEITARNPNKKIGIYYEKGGRLQVWYTKTKLCEGPIPKFYQGHRNVTRLDVDLTGRVQFGNTVLSALQQQQQTGRVPLDLKVDAPVSVKLGKLKMKKVRILGNCKIVVDSLSKNNRINIKASDCKFRLKL
ncbi:Late embryogenesis abundant (LEA) hydroxyproline-rich glycoprotein family [Raphanus sativus]|uniref:NDR1/HIN1-like protein 6 n=1 Tax=Raphanus sativus TaxID=3726 RepID=A0A6J0L4V5_RAPSA|nr:NDR1/HIN1-like protein 6 [Raphanus sativus]KAJ4878324.1 Late embryogenesis abundant (LEA) hydroxyproline-rich glycoprotein family [Raphanus sativus]